MSESTTAKAPAKRRGRPPLTEAQKLDRKKARQRSRWLKLLTAGMPPGSRKNALALAKDSPDAATMAEILLFGSLGDLQHVRATLYARMEGQQRARAEADDLRARARKERDPAARKQLMARAEMRGSAASVSDSGPAVLSKVSAEVRKQIELYAALSDSGYTKITVDVRGVAPAFSADPADCYQRVSSEHDGRYREDDA